MATELHIRLTAAQVEEMRAGRLVIDVDNPMPAEVTTSQISEATGQIVREIPKGKNNFRPAGTCCDCSGYKRQRGANCFRCTRKTFKGDCYLFAALARTCDLFEPKNREKK